MNFKIQKYKSVPYIITHESYIDKLCGKKTNCSVLYSFVSRNSDGEIPNFSLKLRRKEVAFEKPLDRHTCSRLISGCSFMRRTAWFRRSSRTMVVSLAYSPPCEKAAPMRSFERPVRSMSVCRSNKGLRYSFSFSIRAQRYDESSASESVEFRV